MKMTLLTSLVLVAATAMAQDADVKKPAPKVNGQTAKVWVERLGDDDYTVREEATKKLIEMGAKAVPALEEALKSNDLEVRLRAGRALRAIRGDADRAGMGRERVEDDPRENAKPGAKRGQRGVRIFPGNSRIQVEMTDGKVRVKTTELVDGKTVVKTYEGASIEELKKKHPELRGRLGGMDFRINRLRGRQGRDPFNMDDFWKDFWNNDERLRNEMREIESLVDRMRKANGEAQRRGWLNRGRANAPLRGALGAHVQRPSSVLDAQLMLRGRGLVVVMVEKGSLADRLGLEKFDVLISFQGQDPRKPTDVTTALRGVAVGGEVRARVIRQGEQLDLKTKR